MAAAKPMPLVRNEEEILDTYREGLTRASLYKEELLSCEIGRYNLEQTHEYLLQNKNIRGVHLRNIHGFSSKQLGLVDVGVTETQDDDNDDSKEICSHFIKTDKCRFGARCKFEHPKWLVDLLKKNRGVYRNFQKDDKCKFGDRCMYQHIKKSVDANNAEAETSATAESLEVDETTNAKEMTEADFNYGEMLNFEVEESNNSEESENLAKRRKTAIDSDINDFNQTNFLALRTRF